MFLATSLLFNCNEHVVLKKGLFLRITYEEACLSIMVALKKALKETNEKDSYRPFFFTGTLFATTFLVPYVIQKASLTERPR